MTVVPMETEPVLRVGPARVLFTSKIGGSFMIAPDAGRFLAVSGRAADKGPLELRVILNWFEELERLVPHPPR